MTEIPQFLHILAAETDHLVTLDIHLPPEKQHEFQQRILDAYSSDSYSDTAKSWNNQRAEVVREAMEKYLLPAGSKWAREWIREEVEDFLAANCGDVLEEVCMFAYSSSHVITIVLSNRFSESMFKPSELLRWKRAKPHQYFLCPGVKEILKLTLFRSFFWMMVVVFENIAS